MRFADSETMGSKRDIVKRLSSIGSSDALFYAGECMVQMAAYSVEYDVAAERLAKATEYWECAKNTETHQGVSNGSLAAASRLVISPVYFDFAVEKTAPTQETTQTAYENLVNVANSDGIKYIRGSTDDASDRVGFRSELATQLLAYRFAAIHGDGEWAIVPSFIKDDRQPVHPETGLFSSWDLSIHNTDPATEKLALLHKVQVKTSVDASQSYTPDISLVHLNHDLKIDSRDNPAPNIINECIAEISGINSDQATRNLDLRTEKFLDLLVDL